MNIIMTKWVIIRYFLGKSYVEVQCGLPVAAHMTNITYIFNTWTEYEKKKYKLENMNTNTLIII